MKGMPASTTWLQRSDFAVALHEADLLEDGTWDEDVQTLHAAGSDHVRISIAHFSPDMVDRYVESLEEHRLGGGVQYDLPPSPSVTSHVLEHMVLAGACSGNQRPYVAE